MPRPSKHDPITKSYAIDQIEDIEKLREVAHRMWEAFADCHAQEAHLLGVTLDFDRCRKCADYLAGERETGCKKYQQWQRKIEAGFGSL